MAVNEAKLNEFMGNFVRDMGAIAHASTIVIGDQLGLYKALASEPMTADTLATKTGCDPRYILEWLSAQAASGYAEYDPATQKFSLTEEQKMALADEGSPAFIPGAFQVASAMFAAVPKLVDAFRSGAGVGWHEHHPSLFAGTERFFRPGYAANLVGSWIPALDGVEEKLKAGAKVADVGCGHGASTIIMAQAFPNSHFVGFDYHEASIRHARDAAAKAGLGGTVELRGGPRPGFPGRRLSTWWPCSTASTTWAIRSARRVTSSRRSSRTAPG